MVTKSTVPVKTAERVRRVLAAASVVGDEATGYRRDLFGRRRATAAARGGCGIAARSAPVASGARDAGQRDYRTFVERDACGDFARERHDASLAAIEFGFGRVISHNQALDAFSAGKADL